MGERRLELEIRAAHNRTRQTFGPERLQRGLAFHGVKIRICRIRRIRKKLGIRCKQIKKFKATPETAGEEGFWIFFIYQADGKRL